MTLLTTLEPTPAVSQPEPDAAALGAPRLLQGGRDYFSVLIEAIDGAMNWIQLETYIFDFHGVGAEVAQALMRAARRGVSVQVLVDGVGTQQPSAEWQEQLKQSGVQWQVYSPLGFGGGRWQRLAGLGLVMPDRWRRLHRKLCVIDQHVMFCGGINVLDDFFDPNHGSLDSPRFDFAVVLGGAAVEMAVDAMAMLWWRVQAGYSARQRHLKEAWDDFKAAGYGGRTQAVLAEPDSVTGKVRRPRLQAALLLRDNLLNRNSIERAYRKAIGKAHHEILIANAYFLPGGRLRRALIKASRRGVKVTLLLQGKYEYFMQYHAARPVYGSLLEAGVEIHEYEASFLHAKVAVIDGHWATVGSSNLDPLSLLLAREANVVIEDRAFAHELRTRLLEAISGHGRQMKAAIYSARPLRQRVLDQIAYALMRFALLLTRQRY
ncbi:MAG: cardiolipin synthase ClsB [Pseudomonadota bacterium]